MLHSLPSEKKTPSTGRWTTFLFPFLSLPAPHQGKRRIPRRTIPLMVKPTKERLPHQTPSAPAALPHPVLPSLASNQSFGNSSSFKNSPRSRSTTSSSCPNIISTWFTLSILSVFPCSKSRINRNPTPDLKAKSASVIPSNFLLSLTNWLNQFMSKYVSSGITLLHLQCFIPVRV